MSLSPSCRHRAARGTPRKQVDDEYLISYWEKGKDKVYVSPGRLQPNELHRAARVQYVQKDHPVPPFGIAKLSFDPTKVPLTISRKPYKGNPSGIKLEVHVKKAM